MIYVQETNAGTIIISNMVYAVPLEAWEEVDTLGEEAAFTKHSGNIFI